MIRPPRALLVAAALVAVAALATAAASQGSGATSSTAASTASANPSDPAQPEVFPTGSPTRVVPYTVPPDTKLVTGTAAAVQAAPVARLAARLRPDVLLSSSGSLSAAASTSLAGLAAAGRSVSFRSGRLTLAGTQVAAVGVDPSTFRAFTAQGTAESDAVWQAVARGEAVASHATATALKLQLGKDFTLATSAGGSPTTVRLGALATTGLPNEDLIVGNDLGHALGLPARTGMLLAASKAGDAEALAARARAAAGTGATVNLLTASSSLPTAFLSGGDSGKAFGSFSYRYFPDGKIAPDPAWVRENIVTAAVPIFGQVTCNRLMLPQLRGALQEVVNAGLANKLHTYDGCYNPAFIPGTDSISMHSWGIAIDLDAATNYRGIRGTMDAGIVQIFKRWGFRWGGDWHYTDPMHFEIVALMNGPKG